MIHRVVIVEDETAAASNLKSLLAELAPDLEIVAILESVAESVEWLRENEMPDLLFMDIHLADGDSFRIFREIEIPSPVIFTTAYDQYALEAFKVNSIDYLLKPIARTDMQRALGKWSQLSQVERRNYGERIKSLTSQRSGGYPTPQAFLVQVRDRIIPLQKEEIAYFYTRDERVTVCDLKGNIYNLDKSLETLRGVLPEDAFFRANRQFIIARRAVKDISVWFGSRLTLNLVVDLPERIIISKARVPEFKRWLTSSPPSI